MSSTTSEDHTAPERSYHAPAIRPEMTVRHVVALYPRCREVFLKYGEPSDRIGADGAPGPFGHFQPLDQFASQHRVPLDELLQRLAETAGVPIDRDRVAAERIHRGFILAALAITLTLGAAWGGYLLLMIGLREDFVVVDAAHVIAHGEAQLWGFIGLFIVGISLRTVLKDAASTRRRQQLCQAGLGLALLALAAGVAWSLTPQRLTLLGVAGAGLLLVLSAALWSVQWRIVRQKWQATWARAVFMSGLWLVVWAAVTLYLRVQAGSAGPSIYNHDQRMVIIKLAVFGFAMNSIYGFGQMLLPGLLRIGKPRLSAIEWSFWLHNIGVVLMFVASGLPFALGRGVSTIAEPIGSLAVCAGAICYAIGQRGLIGKRRTSVRLEQGHWLLDVYPPLAFAWLIISLLLLSVGDVQTAITGQPLSHAFTGAVRHALTVGFMTTLILGVGQRLIPVLEHNVLRKPALIAPILICIGVGNLWRVTSQLTSLYSPVGFWVMPVSAAFEWTALLLFTISVVSQFARRQTLRDGNAVTQQTSLAELLAARPAIEDKLIQRGFAYLVRARSVPSELTIGSFARSEREDPSELVEWINRQLFYDAKAAQRSPKLGDFG